MILLRGSAEQPAQHCFFNILHCLIIRLDEEEGHYSHLAFCGRAVSALV